jgi:phage-related protein
MDSIFFIDIFVWLIGGIFRIAFFIVQAIIGAIKFAFEAIANLIYNGFKGVFDFIKDFIEFIKSVMEVLNFIVKAYRWFRDFCTDVYNFFESFINWLTGQDDGFGLWLWELVQETLLWLSSFFGQLWERVQKFVLESGEWLFEWIVIILDSIAIWSVNLIKLIFETFGLKLQIPQAAYDGLLVFMQYGMLLNKFLPVKEVFALLALYLMCLLCFSVVRFVFRLIPGY